MKLPPVDLQPLDIEARRAQLGYSQGWFLHWLVGDAPVFHIARTGTKIDVGSWFFKRRVCTCLLESEMLLFAPGKRPYVERIPLGQLKESKYNHVTGEVMLAPAESEKIRGLRMRPLAGLQLLAHIYRGENTP